MRRNYLSKFKLSVVRRTPCVCWWPEWHDDDAGVEHLRVAAEQVRELVAADADLAEVVEDGDHVLADAAAEGERVGGEVVEAEAEGAKELRRAPALFRRF